MATEWTRGKFDTLPWRQEIIDLIESVHDNPEMWPQDLASACGHKLQEESIEGSLADETIDSLKRHLNYIREQIDIAKSGSLTQLSDVIQAIDAEIQEYEEFHC